jgi:hypothetical protein
MGWKCYVFLSVYYGFHSWQLCMNNFRYIGSVQDLIPWKNTSDVISTLVCYNWNFPDHGKSQVISLFCLHYYILWHGLWLWLWMSPICCRLITLWLMEKVIFLLMVACSLSCFKDLAIHMTHKGFHLIKVVKVIGG